MNITYNQLNLPSVIDFGNNDNKTYEYDVDGTKISSKTVDYDGETVETFYCGMFVHEEENSSTNLSFISTAEGRLVNKGSDSAPDFKWEYNLKDHLGNTRAVLSPTDDGLYEALQATHYYPFGMRMSRLSYSINSTDNKYLYNGKEYQDDFGLNWYDYGARMYDAALARWHVIDNKAEEYAFVSPYIYALSNPVLFVDPDGNEVEVSPGIRNNIGVKIFESTKVVQEKLYARFDKGDMSEHRLHIYERNVEGTGFAGIYVLKEGSDPKHISAVTAEDVSGDFRYSFDFGTLPGDTEFASSAATLGHESFLHIEDKIDKIKDLIEKGLTGVELAKELNKVGNSSRIIINGELIDKKLNSGIGARDHYKMISGDDDLFKLFIQQAIASYPNKATVIQKEYDSQKEEYEKEAAWIRYWISVSLQNKKE